MSVLFSNKKVITAVIFAATVLAVVLVILSGIGAEDISSESTGERLIPVKVISPEKGTLTSRLQLNGYIQSDNIVTIIPFVSGTLENISVKVGEQVKKDQLIARIDSRAYDLQLKQAEAAYFGAKSTFERVEQLFKSNATTRQNYEQSRSQFEAYKSQYELAQLQVSYTEILAPMDGTVLIIHSNQGSIAAPELPIITVGDLTELIVKLNIPDKYYEQFTENPEMKTRIIRPGHEAEPIEARIESISPIINAESKNFEITCTLEGDISMLRPGMFVYCIFETGRAEDVYYLPQFILSQGNSLWYVNGETHTAEKIELQQVFMNNDYFAIPDEIAGNRFISEGQSFVRPGQKVEIR